MNGPAGGGGYPGGKRMMWPATAPGGSAGGGPAPLQGTRGPGGDRFVLYCCSGGFLKDCERREGMGGSILGEPEQIWSNDTCICADTFGINIPTNWRMEASEERSTSSIWV